MTFGAIKEISRAKLPRRRRYSSPLTKQRILAVAEQVLLSRGADKATVVEVARLLGLTHANIYKFFANKAKVHQAVVELWLERMDAPLASIVADHASAQVRVVRWLDAFVGARRRAWRENPKLFRALQAVVVQEHPATWDTYKVRLCRGLAEILGDGMASGAFKEGNALELASALIDANVRFFHPAHHLEWSDLRSDAAYNTVRTLLLAGLRGVRDGDAG
jgi:AcrR family transcriptional regulator